MATPAGNDLREILKTLIASVDDNTKALTTTGGAPKGHGNGPKADKAGGGMAGAVSSIVKVVGRVVAVAAAVTAAVVAVNHFVEAINPQVAELFNKALMDLSATIGSGLLPIITIATGVINEIAGVIMPLMEQLKPIIQQVANQLANNLMTVIKQVAYYFNELIPAIQIVVDIWIQLTEAIRLITQIMFTLARTLIQLTKSFIDIDLTDIQSMIKDFGDAVKSMIVQLTLLAAQFATTLGLGDSVKKFREELRKMIDSDKRKARGRQSVLPVEIAIGSVSDIANKMAIAAAGALMGGSQRKETTEEWMEQIYNRLGDIVDKETSENFYEYVKDGLKEIAGNISTMAKAVPLPQAPQAPQVPDPRRRGWGRGWGPGALTREVIE